MNSYNYENEEMITPYMDKLASEGVQFNNAFYRVKITHTGNFLASNFQQMDKLPIVGGATATFPKTFETVASTVNYGIVYNEIQDVVDFLLAYSKYLETVGFSFESYNETLKEIENWQLSAKEFMFWSTQAWEAGTVLTLSPSAREIIFEKKHSVVDDIYDNFYDYSLLQANGKRLLADFATTERDNTNKFGLKVKNTQEGIYQLKLPIII